MTALRFQPQALVDLIEIGDFVAERNPSAALRLMKELRAQCELIARQPQLYRLRPELGDAVRLCPLGRYLIAFEWHTDFTTVLRVLHGARQVKDWL